MSNFFNNVNNPNNNMNNNVNNNMNNNMNYNNQNDGVVYFGRDNKSNKEGSKTIIILLALILVLGIGIGSWYMDQKKNNSQTETKEEGNTENPENPEEPEQPENPEQSNKDADGLDEEELLLRGEKYVTDDNFKNPIIRKYNILSTYHGNFNLFRGKIGLSDVDNKTAINASYRYIDTSKIKKWSSSTSDYCFETANRKFFECDKSTSETIVDNISFSFPGGELVKAYFEMFGGNISKKDYIGCPSLYYLEKEDTYYGKMKCEESSPQNVTYIYRFTQSTKAIEDGKPSVFLYVAYGYLDNSEGVTKVCTDNDCSNYFYSDNNFAINKSNYNKFSLYKVSFAKRNGIYHFYSSEKIK